MLASRLARSSALSRSVARLVARPRLQVCIAQGMQFRGILFQPEADLRAHQHRAQRVERMRDAAVAPVDKDGASAADERRLASVRSPWLSVSGMRYSPSRPHKLGHPRRQVEQPPVLLGRQPGGRPMRRALHVGQERLVQGRQDRQAPIRHAERQEIGNTLRQLDLQLGVARQDGEPGSHVPGRADDLAQPLAGVAHQHPASLRHRPTTAAGRDQVASAPAPRAAPARTDSTGETALK